MKINKSTNLRRDQSDAETEMAQLLDDWDILDFSHVFRRPSIPGHIWHVLKRKAKNAGFTSFYLIPRSVRIGAQWYCLYH